MKGKEVDMEMERKGERVIPEALVVGDGVLGSGPQGLRRRRKMRI